MLPSPLCIKLWLQKNSVITLKTTEKLMRDIGLGEQHTPPAYNGVLDIREK
jgi:hypothetical protein